MKKDGFWSAVFLLTGTTIGAGIFGIPYVTAQVGYPLGFLWLCVLSLFTLFLNLAYATVILRTETESPKQLVGYAQHYLGGIGKDVALVIILLGQWGAILVYLIGIGQFLTIIFNLPGSEQIFSMLIFILVAIATWFNLRSIAALEGWLTLGMILVVLLIGISGSQFVWLDNLFLISEQGLNLRKIFMPFGVMMGALTGYAILPEMASVIKEGQLNKQSLIKTVVIGTLIPVSVYLVFQFVVVGISGSATSEGAVAGLVPFLDVGIIRLGAAFGVLAMLSSFLTLAYVLKDTFQNDYTMPHFRAWVLSFIPPFLVYLAGLRSFIMALEIMGVWLGISSAILILLMYIKSRNS